MSQVQFNAYCSLVCECQHPASWVQHRLQNLDAQLTTHQAMCLPTLHDVTTRFNLPAQSAENFYSLFQQLCLNGQASHLVQWQQSQISVCTYDVCWQCGTSLLHQLRHLLSAHDYIWCQQHWEAALECLYYHEYIQTINQNSSELVRNIFVELKNTVLDVSESEQDSLDLDELELGVLQWLQDWAENRGGTRLSLELELLHSFVHELVLPYAASQRLWELLLLKLDRLFINCCDDPLVNHFSESFEILIAAVQRFSFIRDFYLKTEDAYNALDSRLMPYLCLQLLLQARSEARLNQRWQRQFSLNSWKTLLEKHSLDELKQLHHKAMSTLRQHWERAQLDWLSKATETLHAHLQVPTQSQALAAQIPDSLHSICEPLQGLLYDICLSLALNPQPSDARALLRYRISLLYAPQPNNPIWQGTTWGNSLSAWGQSLDNNINSLFRALPEILRNNLQLRLDWAGDFSNFDPDVPDGVEFPDWSMFLESWAALHCLFEPYQAQAELKAIFVRDYLPHGEGVNAEVLQQVAEDLLDFVYPEV